MLITITNQIGISEDDFIRECSTYDVDTSHHPDAADLADDHQK